MFLENGTKSKKNDAKFAEKGAKCIHNSAKGRSKKQARICQQKVLSLR